MANTPEPWLRGTLGEYDALRRQVLHALELAEEDVARWCSQLSEAELEQRPYNMASAGFHLRHIARSLDRLLTYAEGHQLTQMQHEALTSEMQPSPPLEELRTALQSARQRVQAINPATYEQQRGVGRTQLHSTVGGLLVHVAEHTQRHVGQAISTAQFVVGMRNDSAG